MLVGPSVVHLVIPTELKIYHKMALPIVDYVLVSQILRLSRNLAVHTSLDSGQAIITLKHYTQKFN